MVIEPKTVEKRKEENAMTMNEWMNLTDDEKLVYITMKIVNTAVEPVKINHKRTLHVTHNDLDGVGCFAVGLMLNIYNGEIDYRFVSVNDVDSICSFVFMPPHLQCFS